MTPLNAAILELRLVDVFAQVRAQRMVQQGLAFDKRPLEDHRTEILGELLHAVEQIDRGLGTRLLNALHPGLPPLDEDAAYQAGMKAARALLPPATGVPQ